MKKLVLVAASSLVTIMIMLACNSGDGAAENSASTTAKQPDTVPGKTSGLAFNFDSAIMKMDPIDFRTADMIYDNYRDKIKGKLENRPGNPNNNDFPGQHQQTKHVWFSYSRLREFVDQLATAGDTSELGLRIYLGSYPANFQDANPRRKMTVILCGTKKINGVNWDIPNRDTTKLFAITNYYNHGHLCPPADNCPGALLDEQ